MKRLIPIWLCSMLCTINLSAQAPAPTSYSRDTLIVNEDSILIVVTACAPICSSIVIVENAQGDEKGAIPSPYPHAVFPEAYIENDSIKWRDNTCLIMDEDEKRWQAGQQKCKETNPKQ